MFLHSLLQRGRKKEERPWPLLRLVPPPSFSRWTQTRNFWFLTNLPASNPTSPSEKNGAFSIRMALGASSEDSFESLASKVALLRAP